MTGSSFYRVTVRMTRAGRTLAPFVAVTAATKASTARRRAITTARARLHQVYGTTRGMTFHAGPARRAAHR